MPRRSVYTEEIAGQICEDIAEYGTHRDGYERSGVSRACFYRWLQENREFKDRVRKAEQEFKFSKTDRKIQARKVLDDYLYGRAKRVTKINKKVTSTFFTDEGEEKEAITTEEQTKITTELCPEWVISKILGKDVEELEAFRKLVEAGWIPNDVVGSTINDIEELKVKVKSYFREQNNGD